LVYYRFTADKRGVCR